MSLFSRNVKIRQLLSRMSQKILTYALWGNDSGSNQVARKPRKLCRPGEMWQLSIGCIGWAAAASCLLLNAVDIDHDVNIVDVMLSVRWFSKEDMPSQDHLVSFDLLTILSGQGHISKVVVIFQISIRSTLPLKLVEYCIFKWPFKCLYWFLSIFIKLHLLQFKLLGCSQFGAHVKHFCVC